MLGVPTVADRVAQTVAAMALEARTESIWWRTEGVMERPDVATDRHHLSRSPASV